MKRIPISYLSLEQQKKKHICFATTCGGIYLPTSITIIIVHATGTSVILALNITFIKAKQIDVFGTKIIPWIPKRYVHNPNLFITDSTITQSNKLTGKKQKFKTDFRKHESNTNRNTWKYQSITYISSAV